MSDRSVEGYNGTLEQRLWSKVDKRGPLECWLWTASKSPEGYGQLWQSPRHPTMARAHRIAYGICVGPIPEGLTLDHLCRNPSCVNPAHLEPVTTGVNTLRGDTFQAKNAAKTTCPRGHAYDRIYSDKRRARTRICGTCKNDLQRKRRAEAKKAK